MPKILNISTERKNDDEYFNHFSTNYNRIIQTCSKLLNSLMLKVNGGYKLEPSFSEEYGGPIFHSSDLIHHLSTNHNISMEQFVETIMQEIPGALDNHEIDVEGLMKFIQKEDLEHGHNSSSCLQSGEIAEVISSVVKFCEVIKLKRYLSKTFTHIVFDLENSKIYTDKDRNHSLKFSDLSSGIRQKFRIFTSMAMQVISADKSLILIDEPEISLHLSWQRTFVDDLTEFLIDLVSKSRITVDGEDELQNIISVLISTHSPAVLANPYHRGQKIGESDLFEE